MPRFTERFIPSDPKYRLHKATGQAVVTLGGKDFYLGRHNTPESRAAYHRLLGEWNAAGRPRNWNPQASQGLTILEVMDRYWQHAKGHYGTSRELDNVKRVLKLLKKHYGTTQALSFGPLALKSLREGMIAADHSRRHINANIGRLKRMFKWACSEELLPAPIYQALAAVAGLQRGRSKARETAPVTPIADHIVDATLPYMPPLIADMVRLQRLTGARPGEICCLRPCDIDRSSDVWAFRPSSHKTAYKEHDRVIFFGPRAQAILAPYLLRDSNSNCFNPSESEAKRRQERHERRQIPLSYGNRPGSNRRRRPKVKPGESYGVASYRRAIHRACLVADRAAHVEQSAVPPETKLVPIWGPHRLRHTAATEIRKRFGIEAAANVLGHSDSFVTLVYAEADLSKAAAVMREVG